MSSKQARTDLLSALQTCEKHRNDPPKQAKGRDVFRQVLGLRSHDEHEVMSLGKRAVLAGQALNHLYKRPIISAAGLASDGFMRLKLI